MTMKSTAPHREYDKFEETPLGETSVRTTPYPKSGSLLVDVEYDAISAAYPNDTTEVYSFYQNGLTGTLTATVTIVYTSNTKDDISTVVRS